MKKHLSLILVLLPALSLALPATAQQHKEVGVVLNGGGTKGVTHTQTLRVIEEAGIPIDYIVGTSVGSIVGGLYSIGYAPHQLDNMVHKQDRMFLLSDRVKRSAMSLNEREKSERYVSSFPFTKSPKDAVSGGIIKGQDLANLFTELTVGYHDSVDFNKLPIPFACVSQSIVNDGQTVLYNGVLATAMRASMAIPEVFTPVRKDSMILIDGGMINNYPVDVAKSMGADVIIGAGMQNNLEGIDKFNGAPDILSQVIDLTTKSNHQKNISLTDTYIKANVEGYSSASFTPSAIDSLMHQEGEAAHKQWNSLLALKKKIGIVDTFKPEPHGPYTLFSSARTLSMEEVTFSDVEESDKKWLMKKCKLQENSKISMRQIEQALFILRGNQSYSDASYTLINTPKGYNLTLLLEKKYEKTINVSLRFDSEEIASLSINATTQLKTHIPSKVSVIGRLGKRYMTRVDYTPEPMQQRNINFSYMFQYNDINIHDHGDRVYNTTYKYHPGEFGFSDVWYKNLQFGFGARVKYFKYKDFLFKKPEFTMDINSEYFISYLAQLRYDTSNKGYFPSKGSNFSGAYSLYTDNLARYNRHAPFSTLSASWESVFSVSSCPALIPAIYGRVLIGQEIPYAYENALGSDASRRYLPQQLPFVRICNIELTHNSVAVASLKPRQHMGSRHYITLTGNSAPSDDNFFEILKGNRIYGCSIGYGLDSILGPLEALLGYSNQSKDVGFYVNLGFSL